MVWKVFELKAVLVLVTSIGAFFIVKSLQNVSLPNLIFLATLGLFLLVLVSLYSLKRQRIEGRGE